MKSSEELRQRVNREQSLLARLRTAANRLADAQIERTWAIVSSHRAGLSTRQIAAATGLSSSRVHQLMEVADAHEIPEGLSELREIGQLSDGEMGLDPANPVAGIRSRVASEVVWLRRCIDWLKCLEHEESVMVNLRPDADTETEYVSFDRLRVVKVLERITADLDEIARHGISGASEETAHAQEIHFRHRRNLAEPQPTPKKLTHREERAALRAAAGLPPESETGSLFRKLDTLA